MILNMTIYWWWNCYSIVIIQLLMYVLGRGGNDKRRHSNTQQTNDGTQKDAHNFQLSVERVAD